MIGQPAAMAEQIAQPQFARDERIVHAKARIMVDHAVIPVDPSFAHQRRQHGRRDWLRHRRHLKHGVGIDPFRLARLAHAKALLVNDLVLMDHRDGNARHAGACERLVRKFLEFG